MGQRLSARVDPEIFFWRSPTAIRGWNEVFDFSAIKELGVATGGEAIKQLVEESMVKSISKSGPQYRCVVLIESLHSMIS